MRGNAENIRNENFGKVRINLEKGIKSLISEKEKRESREYVEKFAGSILSGLEFYYPIVPDKVKDPGVKQGAKDYLLNYIAPGGAIDIKKYEQSEIN